MKMHLVTWALTLSILMAAAGPGRAAEGEAAEGATPAGLEAISRPSEDLTLSFVRPGRISAVTVKEGDEVKAGQLLVQQDDAAEQLQLQQLKAQSEDLTRIQAAQAQVDQKKEDLKKIEWCRERGAATEWEFGHARLEVTIAELSLKLAEFQRQQDTLKFREVQAEVERMRLVSPVAGRVEKVYLRPGEAGNAQDKVLRVVRTDPLWIDAAVPLELARRLKCRQPAEVEFAGDEVAGAPGLVPPDPPRTVPAGQAPTPAAAGSVRVTGAVSFMAAVADAASETVTVRIEVPNTAGRRAGEHVRVHFPAAAPSGAARVSQEQ